MRLTLLVCEVFFREISSLVANAPHRCDMQFLPKGLHDLGTAKMAARLQACIDTVDADDIDAIVLVYGLCNNGVVGLSTKHTRLVIPKAHDCISLFLGDRRRYAEEFEQHPGTYYRTSGWLERDDATSAGEETVFQQLGLTMQYEEMVRKYGEENARYVMETMGGGTQHYERLAYINMGLPCEDQFRDNARKEAKERELAFVELEGSMDLLKRLVYGEWDDDILVLEPGSVIEARHDDSVIGCNQCTERRGD